MKGFWLGVLLLALPARAEWGRLFFSAEERAAIDNPLHASGPARSHRFNGELRSSQGQIVRWIDGKAGMDGEIPAHVRPGESWHDLPEQKRQQGGGR